jgi:hypothetical protein
MRTPIYPSWGLVRDRDGNADVNILLAGPAELAARYCTAGQAETGSSSPERNASGQTSADGRKRSRSVKMAG